MEFLQPPSRPTATLLAIASLPAFGCSWLFVTKPPPGPLEPAPPAACTSSVAAPVIDTIVGAVLAAEGIAAIASVASAPNASGEGWFLGGSIGGLLLAAAVPLGFSAGHGYATTHECRQLKEAQLSCVSGVEASCQSLKERKP